MPKVFVIDPNEIEEMMQQRAEDIFHDVVEITKKHGVCYLRFTKADGMAIINPKYNQQLNGVISDA